MEPMIFFSTSLAMDRMYDLNLRSGLSLNANKLSIGSGPTLKEHPFVMDTNCNITGLGFEVLTVTRYLPPTEILKLGQRRDHLTGFVHLEFGVCIHILL